MQLSLASLFLALVAVTHAYAASSGYISTSEVSVSIVVDDKSNLLEIYAAAGSPAPQTVTYTGPSVILLSSSTAKVAIQAAKDEEPADAQEFGKHNILKRQRSEQQRIEYKQPADTFRATITWDEVIQTSSTQLTVTGSSTR
jgi:hypothetical protein